MAKRTWYAGATVLLVVAATAAEAAPPKVKKVCNLATDPGGDARDFVLLQTNGQWPPVDALDILRVDVASAANTLTGVIQVKKLAATEPTAPLGMSWRVEFKPQSNPEQLLYVQAMSDHTGAITYEAGVFDNGAYAPIKAMTGHFDTKANQVRIHMPNQMNLFNGPAKRPLVNGFKLLDISAKAGRRGPFTPYEADKADSKAGYVLGTPSCVVPGK